MYAIVYNYEKLSHDFETVMTKHIKQLHLVSAIIEPYAELFVSDQFPSVSTINTPYPKGVVH